MTSREKIRLRLRLERTAKGWTIENVADKLGISTCYYNALELGTRTGSVNVWDKLERLFNIPQIQLRELLPFKNS